MRKLLKIVLWFIGSVLAVVLVAAAVVYGSSHRRLHRTYHVAVTPVALPSDQAAVERGQHIARTRGCIDCHGADFGGAKVVEDPAIGRLYGPNITRGAGGLPSGYSDEDWVRAIRHGINANGRPLFLMPSHEYAHLTQDDLGALIAYMKTVAPVDRARVPVSVGPVGRVLVVTGRFPIAAEVIDHANLQPATVKPGLTVDYGRYLAVGCIGCHGSNYAGGRIPGGPPDWPPAANLTPHPTATVTQWKETDFLKALRTGQRPDGTGISPVMPRAFGQMTDDELGSIWLYLKTLPAAATGSR